MRKLQDRKYIIRLFLRFSWGVDSAVARRSDSSTQAAEHLEGRNAMLFEPGTLAHSAGKS